ncbi:carboxylesterase family protein [Hyalangium versicolor]|uniref:carboxylesterase family protein n=1 Tax=Hyalangium versicolor TaxID=2861190 RepID=UPI001CCF2729|nr:alpha/beta hydrolase-fold protein [Hyalangium versicolor]
MAHTKRHLSRLPVLVTSLALLQGALASEASAAERRFLIDFGSSSFQTPGWNNLTDGTTGATLTGLKDSTGASSSLALQVTDSFWQGWIGAYNGDGTTASTLYPATATQDSFFIGNHQGSLDDTAKLQFSGLSATATYTLRFYASRVTTDLTTDRTAVFTVSGQTVELQARNNVDTSAQLASLSPTSGLLDITMTMKPGAAYSYLGIIELIENGSVVVNQPPTANAGSDKTIPLPSNTVALQQTVGDPEGKAVTWLWTQVSGPSTARLYQNPWSPLIAGDLVQGTYVFRLTVTDDLGATASDDVQVSVVPSTGSGTPTSRTLTSKTVTSNGKLIYYYESLPRGYNTDPTRKWPLIVFHHGIGERGDTADTLPAILGASLPIRDGAPLEFVQNGVTESFVILMPQLHGSYGDWQDFFTQAAIDTAKTNLRIDPDRVYLVGYSLGAFHTWSFPQRSDANANQIAAIAPVSGGRIVSSGGVSQICRLANKKVPVWASHAVDDHTVGVSSTDDAVNALNSCVPAPNPAPKYTRYTTGDHWILGWVVDPNNPDASNLYKWLLTQRRNTNISPVVQTGPAQTITLPTSSVTLTGSASDADGTIASYSWTKVSGGTASFSTPTAASTTVSGLVQGTYVFRLTVTDNLGATASADVTVTVLPVPGGNNPAARTLTVRSTRVPKLYNTFLGFYESLPRGYDNDPSRQWPLIIFLHGLGQRGNGTTELPWVLEQGMPALINAGEQLEYPVNGVNDSFVVLMPQLGASASDWHAYYVDRLIDYAQANYRIDPRRIYVTGLSMGAFGTTGYPEMSLAHAQRLAAIAPTDGAGYGTDMWTPDLGNVPRNTCNLVQASVKVWQFYGTADSWMGTATDFVARYNACNPPPELTPKVTAYPGVGHGAWGRTYDPGHTHQNPNLYEWLLAQQRPE